jgi:hypothetical protein
MKPKFIKVTLDESREDLYIDVNNIKSFHQLAYDGGTMIHLYEGSPFADDTYL